MKFFIDRIPEEKRDETAAVITGTTTCPNCEQSNVKVTDESGKKIIDTFILENHFPAGVRKNLCSGSGKRLDSFLGSWFEFSEE
jgi:hypothetical protein